MGFKELKNSFIDFQDKAFLYFSGAFESTKGHDLFETSPDAFWNRLTEEQQQESLDLQQEFLKLIGMLANYVKRAPLLSEADENDLIRCTKEIRAALKLRAYRAWETEILNDEDVVLGVRRAGQSESHQASPGEANRAFVSAMNTLSSLAELVEASPEAPSSSISSTTSTTKYRPNTVFVMMWIDPTDPILEDAYDTIKNSCMKFGLKALRADEIEHEEVITDKILSEIKTSEFLIADLTGERPSVYYEIGYAHSLGRRVIMYRREGTRIHFDLAAFNCPEYRNNTELRKKLLRRLEDVTNRKSSDS